MAHRLLIDTLVLAADKRPSPDLELRSIVEELVEAHRPSLKTFLEAIVSQPASASFVAEVRNYAFSYVMLLLQ